MNEKINKIAEELRKAVIDECSDITVSANVFINCQGSNFEINQRTPESLKNEGSSMRNLKGEFIK